MQNPPGKFHTGDIWAYGTPHGQQWLILDAGDGLSGVTMLRLSGPCKEGPVVGYSINPRSFKLLWNFIAHAQEKEGTTQSV